MEETVSYKYVRTTASQLAVGTGKNMPVSCSMSSL